MGDSNFQQLIFIPVTDKIKQSHPWYLLCMVFVVHGICCAWYFLQGICCAWYFLCMVFAAHSICCTWLFNTDDVGDEFFVFLQVTLL